MSLEDLYELTNTIDDVTLYCHLTICDPIMFETTIKDEKWRIIMDEEIASIEKNNTWRLVLRPNRKRLIGVKWIYREKKNVKEEVERYKAKLVTKGYSQKHEINYDEVFAPI